jgi:hypothetical protein
LFIDRDKIIRKGFISVISILYINIFFKKGGENSAGDVECTGPLGIC